jgi:RNA polymerase sigma-70 factor, ECF subfamily
MTQLQGTVTVNAPPAFRAGNPSVALQTAHALARRTWPGVTLSYERFRAHVTREGSAPAVVPAHPADLYLCAACLDGQAAAYQSLESAHFPALRAIVRRLLDDPSAVEEVLQEVRTRLFVGDSPKIASYRGSGCLSGWLRSVAVHAAQDHLRAVSVRRGWLRKLERTQHANAALATDATDEQAFQTQRASVCEQAWNSAIRSLGSSERQLLHHHFVSGLSIDVLGAIYAVHRATIARRIRRATDRVRRRVREALATNYHGLCAADLDALALRACGDVDVMRTLEPSYAA